VPNVSFRLPRVVAIVALLALAVMAIAGSIRDAAAQDAATVHLFNVVSARDEVVIGLTEAEVPALASRAPVAVVANLLASDGRLSAWRYAPMRGEDGVIRLTPIYRLAIFAGGTIRLEPYAAAADQEVVAPAE
jgi:hypothetical protein